MYKLVVRSVLLLFAGLLILPGSPGIRSTQAQGIDDDDRDDGIPFSHNGKVWPSKKAFIDSGARCATPSVDEIRGGQIHDFLEKLKATPDGDGSLLDHSLYLYGSGMGNPDVHDHVNLPILVAGGGAGKLKGGRHIKYSQPTPLANLHLTLLDKAGVHLDAFADSQGKIKELLEPLTV